MTDDGMMWRQVEHHISDEMVSVDKSNTEMTPTHRISNEFI